MTSAHACVIAHSTVCLTWLEVLDRELIPSWIQFRVFSPIPHLLPS